MLKNFLVGGGGGGVLGIASRLLYFSKYTPVAGSVLTILCILVELSSLANVGYEFGNIYFKQLLQL